MKTDAPVVTSPALVRIVALHAALRCIEQYGEHHGRGAALTHAPPDLYRELQAFTPNSLQYVLDDLFGAAATPGVKRDR